jgi:heme A synthase
MAGHLINTFILLLFLSLTAWTAGGHRRLQFDLSGKEIALLVVGLAGILFVGVTGSVAALSSMIFPSQSITEGIAKDFSTTSNVLLRIRPLHPILSVATVVYLIFLSGWLRSWSGGNANVARWANILSIVALAQLLFGAATLLTLAPIVMQLGHLLLADAIWISFVLLTASYLGANSPAEQPVAMAEMPLA